MKITYNSPVILTYTLICVAITTLDTTIFFSMDGRGVGNLSRYLFMVYPFGTSYMDLGNPLAYFRLFSHAFGHANWEHLVGNFSFILLLGPILEEKYGSRMLIVVMFLTAFITGILNALLFANSLLGASGIVFMMILLVSFTNVRKGAIPMTFILIALLFLGKEIYSALLVNNQISEFAHIIGGVCGGIFGYALRPNASEPKPKKSKPKQNSVSEPQDIDVTNLTNLG